VHVADQPIVHTAPASGEVMRYVQRAFRSGVIA
jgi:hypothetical protein